MGNDHGGRGWGGDGGGGGLQGAGRGCLDGTRRRWLDGAGGGAEAERIELSGRGRVRRVRRQRVRGRGRGGGAAAMVGRQAERITQRVGEVPARVVPFLRGLGHRLGHDVIDGGGQVRPQGHQGRGRDGQGRG